MFDAGTNNQKLLKEPFYMGLQHKRLKGSAYFELLDEFIFAVTARSVVLFNIYNIPPPPPPRPCSPLSSSSSGSTCLFFPRI
jgi:hypothetical protein